MGVSRRDFLRGAGAGTALGTLGALGVGFEAPLAWAMDRIAERFKNTRDDTFVERTQDGKALNHTLGIFSLGGATMDNEFNYAHSKLMRAVGVVAIENQARI